VAGIVSILDRSGSSPPTLSHFASDRVRIASDGDVKRHEDN